MNTIYLTPDDNLQQRINELDGPAVVQLCNGIYRQKVEILKDDITICGEGRDTVITYDDYARKIHADGAEYNTFRTYTLSIVGNNVTLKNLTVSNSNTDPARVGQCVALSVHGNNFYGSNLELKSTQDTLFLSPFPDDLVVRYANFIPDRQLYREGTNVHLFENCDIYGTVDYIFGCAEAYFRRCNLISLGDSRNIGFVAAPAHPLASERGFTFVDCSFSSFGATPNTNYLARPWRDFGKCDFINCKLDGHIKPALFDKWNDTYRDKTARFNYYNLQCAFTPAPVQWAKQLSKQQAQRIISACDKAFENR